ncbi:flagellar protein FliO/FliZ [Eubacterium oxidoreducens]|uniref:Flagellar protein FliO/FliZ n=1 Tax=Eubacterium oxidoreducens TaxID=1732 RepID=A0A1G6APY4_EUBOX|nr:flagellar protein FliO/FliZ [Eubacterium oxidoreducens]
MIEVLVIFVFVLVITVVTTKLLANYQKGRIAGSHIQVIEAMKIGNNKYIQIVQVVDEYYVIALSKDNVSMLGQITKEEGEALKRSKNTGNTAFGKTLNEVMAKFKDTLPKK